MNSRKNIEDELKGLDSGLPAGSGQQPFDVPAGYFDGLAASIMAKLKTESTAAEEIQTLSPLLAGISRTMPYAVDHDYFVSNLEAISTVTAQDPRSAILDLVDQVTPYHVPTDYFDNVPEQILRKVGKPAKVVPLRSRRWMQMAAAAMVAGIIAVSGWFYINQKDGTGTEQPVAQQLKNVSTKELDEFLKTADITPASKSTAQMSTSGEAEIRNMLKDVSTQELDRFLDQIPTDDEDLLVIN